MTDAMTSQNVDLSSWDTLYILNFIPLDRAVSLMRIPQVPNSDLFSVTD
jgi:hypothetical protein